MICCSTYIFHFGTFEVNIPFEHALHANLSIASQRKYYISFNFSPDHLVRINMDICENVLCKQVQVCTVKVLKYYSGTVVLKKNAQHRPNQRGMTEFFNKKQRNTFWIQLYTDTVVDDTGSLRRIADHQATTHRDWLICARHLPRTLATLSGLSISHTTSHHSVP